MWCLCSNGYLLAFNVYRGKGQDAREHGHHTQAAIDLMQPYLNRGHIVFLDSLFSSPALFDYLEAHGTRACGTLRPNRKGLPADLKLTKKQKARLANGDMKCWQRGLLGCLRWKDRSVVHVLSNHMRVDTTLEVKEERSDGSSVTKVKPTVVHEYNLHRGGVDTVDQLHGNYAMGRKSKKNWPRLAWWLLDMCVVNAYRLFTLHTGSAASQLDFRVALTHQLAGAYPPQRVHEQPAPSHGAGRPSHPHYPKRSAKSRDCRHCSRQREGRVVSNFVCDHCDVHLCVDPCFKLYHEAM